MTHEGPVIDPRILHVLPEDARLRSSLADFYGRATPNQVLESLGAVWTMLDRGALWLSSVHLDVCGESNDFVERTAAAFLTVVADRLRAIADLGRQNLDHVPTATTGSRAALETALRLRWIIDAEDERSKILRVVALHDRQVRWKKQVAAEMDRVGNDGERWRKAAEKHSAVVVAGREAIGEAELPRVPPVINQLQSLGLGRLYHGYRLASEYAHGGLTGALETESLTVERSPFGRYWPQDWYLALSISAWSCALVAGYASQDFDLGPVRGLILAADIISLTPGPRPEQNAK